MDSVYWLYGQIIAYSCFYFFKSVSVLSCSLDIDTISDNNNHIFLKRKVDKGACIRFRGKRYETKPSLIGHTVEISYDPAAPEQITISYQGMEPFTAAPLKIGPYCDKRPTLPASMQEQTPTTSRFLDALEVRHKQNQQQMADAISFASYRKEADDWCMKPSLVWNILRLYGMSRRKNCMNPMHSARPLDGCPMWQTVRCLLS